MPNTNADTQTQIDSSLAVLDELDPTLTAIEDEVTERPGLLGEWDQIQEEIQRRGLIELPPEHRYLSALKFRSYLTDAFYYASTGKRASVTHDRHGTWWAPDVTPVGMDDWARWLVIDPERATEVGKLLARAMIDIKRDEEFSVLAEDIEHTERQKANEVNTGRHDDLLDRLVAYVEKRGEQGADTSEIRRSVSDNRYVPKRLAEAVDAGRLRMIQTGRKKTYYPGDGVATGSD